MDWRWNELPGYTEVRGAVAEWCRECDDIRVFAVEDRMVVNTFLVWKLSTTCDASRLVCWQCGWWIWLTAANASRLDGVMRTREAERLPLPEVVRRTNPDLYDEFYW